MDTLASVGSVLATPQMYIGFLVGFAMVAYGLYILTADPSWYSPPSQGGVMPNVNPALLFWGDKRVGYTMIVLGLLIAFSGWLRRKFVRSSPEAAAVVGFFDITRVFRRY